MIGFVFLYNSFVYVSHLVKHFDLFKNILYTIILPSSVSFVFPPGSRYILFQVSAHNWWLTGTGKAQSLPHLYSTRLHKASEKSVGSRFGKRFGILLLLKVLWKQLHYRAVGLGSRKLQFDFETACGSRKSTTPLGKCQDSDWFLFQRLATNELTPMLHWSLLNRGRYGLKYLFFNPVQGVSGAHNSPEWILALWCYCCD